MTGGSGDLTHADLMAMHQGELDALYRSLVEPGSVPSGKTRGSAVLLPDRSVGAIVGMATRFIFWQVARLLFWQGKVFDPNRAELQNSITPFGLKAIRARVYTGESWLDVGGKATIIDYSETSWIARPIRDEIRQVGPDLWLGKVFVGKWHAVDFILTS